MIFFIIIFSMILNENVMLPVMSNKNPLIICALH